MKRLRLLIRNYFGFSKTETNGFLVFVPLMVFMLFAPTLYVKVFSKEYDGFERDQQVLDSLLVSWNKTIVPLQQKEEVPEAEVVLRAFNPNKASEAELEGLGVPQFIARRIINYRSKGGEFRTKADLSRIYDFPDSLFHALRPYIELPDKLERSVKKFTAMKAGRAVEGKKPTSSSVKPGVKKEAPLFIDLNACDTTELKKLRGIGSGYSKRIIKYRELLGGFTRQEQLAEVYGLSDSLYQSLSGQVFVKEGHAARKVNVNIADFKALNRHPYISYKQAGAILNTRSKRGKFRSPLDLLVVEGMDSVKVSQLAPYISF